MLILFSSSDFKKDYIIIELEFFGVLKRFFEYSLFFQVFSGITILQLRKMLVFFLKKNNIFFNVDLLRSSVFSNYSEVLLDDFVLIFSQKLFILPPVTGG